MKAVEAPLERVARGVAVVACAWFAFAAAWGCFQIPGAGHNDGSSAAVALHALPIVRWHILYPSSDTFGSAPPSPATYYCHHPFGVFYLSALIEFVLGKHDIVVPCCDPERYSRDFGQHDHPSCLRNLEQARDLLGESFDIRGEQAWNVFMHNRVAPEGKVVTDPAAHPAGATITLRAEMDVVGLLSACPQDLTPCNDFDPTPMKLVVREG